MGSTICKQYNFDEELIVLLKGEIIQRIVSNNQDGSVKLTLHFKACDHEIKRA